MYLIRFILNSHSDDINDVLVFPELVLECCLQLNVVLHEADIGAVASHQHYTLIPHDGVVQEEDYQHDQV